MKLLTQTDARSQKKREYDLFVESTVRLSKYKDTLVQKLNTLKDNYEPEKLQILKEFENFQKDIRERKSKELQELAGIQQAVKLAKETYYGLIEKQDTLMEKEYRINEENKKLDLRHAFVSDLEEKFRNKTL